VHQIYIQLKVFYEDEKNWTWMIFNSKFHFAFPTKLDTPHLKHSCFKQLIHQILNTYQLNQYKKLRLKTPFLFPNPFVYYKHCYIYIIQEHEQKNSPINMIKLSLSFN
jgi:hypothetical protein